MRDKNPARTQFARHCAVSESETGDLPTLTLHGANPDGVDIVAAACAMERWALLGDAYVESTASLTWTYRAHLAALEAMGIGSPEESIARVARQWVETRCHCGCLTSFQLDAPGRGIAGEASHGYPFAIAGARCAPSWPQTGTSQVCGSRSPSSPTQPDCTAGPTARSVRSSQTERVASLSRARMVARADDGPEVLDESVSRVCGVPGRMPTVQRVAERRRESTVDAV